LSVIVIIINISNVDERKYRMFVLRDISMIFCRSWYGWLTGELAGKEMIVPEVSRVTREPVDGARTNDSDFLLQLFNRPRSFSECVTYSL